MVKPAEIELIFWDLGDVLVSLDFQRLFGVICPLLDTTPEAFHQALFSTGIFDRTNRGLTSPQEFYAEALEALEVSPQDVDFESFAEAWVQFFQPRPAMAQIVEQLSGQVSQWLLSNTDPLHHQACQREYPYLEHLTGQLTSYGLGAMKPEADIYHRALKQAGGRPETSLFFDDKEENIQGARALGIHAYQFTSHQECLEILRTLGLM